MAVCFSCCPSPPLFSQTLNRAAIPCSFSSLQFRFPRYPLKKISLTLLPASVSASSPAGTKITDFDSVVDELDPEEEEDLAASPWEGAVVYRRDSSVTHAEYCTTLERLGLARISSGISRSRAAEMGIRIPARRAKESGLANETPVLVSIDVARRKSRLKLDGILRTVISLRCNRCAGPAAENVYSNFSLLLTENPVDKELDVVDMGVLYGANKIKSSPSIGDIDEMEDDEKLIDEDDRLYFPPEAKEIDLSKHIRDLVHVEITINSICNPNCKGLCLKCGTNLNNNSTCGCSHVVEQGTKYGPLRDLRKQMQSQ
ncbi:hypothetical protein KSP39_PZI011352 [Platanthera zijinensis]|uniref:Large ribosomal RNA subunit accumulation protein YCED homolog 1, chloroplastic n=1 Tax=Platanthera zijinensis TaxID=2320716 RepID=A0AAP0BH18_9ASPA